MSSVSRPRPLYRARQFLKALRPRISERQLREAKAYLSEEQWVLFEAMALPDQRHCLDVFQTLRRQGQDDETLLTAALLHDVGKRGVSLGHRVAYVLLKPILPRLPANGGLAALHHHAERGAQLAESAGASDAVVRLIRGDPGDPRAAILQAADDSC